MTAAILAVLILSLGDGRHANRESASRALDRLGSWGYAVAERHAGGRNAEIACRCRAFLDTFKSCLTCGGKGPCEFCCGTGIWRHN